MNYSQRRRHFVAYRPLTPLAIGTGMDIQNHRVAQRHIPGSVIRGSLGSKMYRAKGCAHSPLTQRERPSNRELDQIFGPGGVRFGPLYPAWDQGDFGEELQDRVLDSIQIPLTAWTCKAEPGLRYSQECAREEHMTIDIAFEHGREPKHVPKCKCGSRFERIRGYVSRVKDDTLGGECWIRVTPSVRERTRVGLNRQSATAEDGILHSLEVVQPVIPAPGLSAGVDHNPLLFVGYWSMTEEQHYILTNELRPFEKRAGFEIEVGACQSSGLGQGILWLSQSPEPIPNGMELFRRDGMNIFAITARSPLICVDEAGVVQTLLTPKVIRQYFPGAPSFVLLENGCYLEREKASGWAGLWGLPKPVSDATSAGSVFVYTSDASIDELMPFFEALMTDGIGERLEEGFGQVDVNHAFHNRFGDKGESE